MSESKNLRRIGVVILAAGGSSRLGQPMQLIMFQNKSLLQNIIDQSHEAFDFSSHVLVLGAYASVIKKSINNGNFKVIINEKWQEGIASSIRKGVEDSLEIDPELESILILLSDQPFVTKKLISELIETHQKKGEEITASKYEDTVGVPAIFNKRLFKELCLLEGDRGAKVLIRKYQDKVATIPFELGSIDVDMPEDYHKLLN